MYGLGPWKWVIVLIIVIMLFGGKRIPEIMDGLGKGLRTFKKVLEGEDGPKETSGESGRRDEKP